MICAVCGVPASAFNRVYDLQHVLHDLRIACEHTHVRPLPQPGSFAHPSCVSTLKAKIERTVARRHIDRQSWSMQ